MLTTIRLAAATDHSHESSKGHDGDMRDEALWAALSADAKTPS